MIALTFLFILILGLLMCLFFLFRSYFISYARLHRDEDVCELQHKKKLYLKQSILIEKEKEIQDLLVRRLTELEMSSSAEPEASEQTAFFANFKKLMNATLNLLKQNNTKRRN